MNADEAEEQRKMLRRGKEWDTINHRRKSWADPKKAEAGKHRKRVRF